MSTLQKNIRTASPLAMLCSEDSAPNMEYFEGGKAGKEVFRTKESSSQLCGRAWTLGVVATLKEPGCE